MTLGVLNLLTFTEVVETHPLKTGHVEEQVSLVRVDETEALIRQLLDCTLRHFFFLVDFHCLAFVEHPLSELPDRESNPKL